MRHVSKIIVISFFLLRAGFAFSQYEYKKEKIYLNFNKEIKNCPYNDIKLKWFKKEGLQFNLCGGGVFLFPKGKKADTLCLTKFKNYPVTTMNEVEQKVKAFRYKTYKKSPPHKEDKAYQFYNKNDIFKTYLIEVIGDGRFVVYPVNWRKQDVIE